jgi:A/G-specific adenine glycosylase
MLQQTTVRAVVPYYGRFLRRFPSIRALARAPLTEVLTAWSGLGYYRRARHLHAAARHIVEEHGGRFPNRREQILALPGIGRYTAGALLSIAFGRQEPVLDGNVARVLSRLFLLRAHRAAAREMRLWRLAGALVSAAPSPGDLNQALMDLGATICTPIRPGCVVCPIEPYCAARAAGQEERIPAPRRGRATVLVRAACAVVRRNGRYLMRQRDGGGLMGGLWEFPPIAPSRAPGLRVLSLGRLAMVRHSITYRRILLEVHRARLLSEPRARRYRWVTPRQIRRLPTSSLVPKVLASLRRSRSV